MTDITPKPRYRTVGGKQLIEVRVRTALQLFDARDPAPFRARDLDDDFTEYIVSSADEVSTSDPLKILIYVEEPATPGLDKSSISEAMRTHFRYQIDLKRVQLAKVFKTARLFLGIGLICMVFCLLLARFLEAHMTDGPGHIVKEGLVIFGWVSMWKPFELVLFDWYPLYDRIRLFKQLVKTEIGVVFEAAAEEQL